MTTYSTATLDWGVRTRVIDSDGQRNEVIVLAENLGDAVQQMHRLPRRPDVQRELVCRSSRHAPGQGWKTVTA
jgi:hypothetical protein